MIHLDTQSIWPAVVTSGTWRKSFVQQLWTCMLLQPLSSHTKKFGVSLHGLNFCPQIAHLIILLTHKTSLVQHGIGAHIHYPFISFNFQFPLTHMDIYILPTILVFARLLWIPIFPILGDLLIGAVYIGSWYFKSDAFRFWTRQISSTSQLWRKGWYIIAYKADQSCLIHCTNDWSGIDLKFRLPYGWLTVLVQLYSSDLHDPD